jgi:SAM-dependent methyltransferase
MPGNVSKPSASDPILQPVADYYARKLASHGATPPGVDWNSTEGQQLRFEQLCKLFERPSIGRVIDYGCGYGALAEYLRSRGYAFEYWGYDICQPMVDAASALFSGDAAVHFTSDRQSLPPADYCVASGIFNVRLESDDKAWRAYICRTIDDMAALAGRGIAFNALTSYSDPPKQRADLFYSDPRELFDYCVRTVSRRVALLHDYPLFEFTLIVRTS